MKNRNRTDQFGIGFLFCSFNVECSRYLASVIEQGRTEEGLERGILNATGYYSDCH